MVLGRSAVEKGMSDVRPVEDWPEWRGNSSTAGQPVPAAEGWNVRRCQAMTAGGHDRREAENGRSRRLAELDERLAAGEFDLAVDGAGYTGPRGAEQQRQAFALAAWAARVGVDPAEDFDAFVAELWASVDSLYQVSERVGGGEQASWDVFPPGLARGDDPPVVWWGEE